MTDADVKLKSLLQAWRLERFIEFNGGEHDPDDTVGPLTFMSGRVLQRLVDLAHFGAFKSNEQLIRDVDWCLIDVHAKSLRKIMELSHPTVQVPSLPVASSSDVCTATVNPAAKPK
jgi:hypothetical protein